MAQGDKLGGMSGWFLLSFLPSRGRQFRHAVDRPLAEFGEDVVEVLAQIDLQAAAGFHDGSNGGDFRSGLLAANMEPIFLFMTSLS